MTTQLAVAQDRLDRKRKLAAELFPDVAAPLRAMNLEALFRRLEEASEKYEEAPCAFCGRATVDLGEVPVSCGLRACTELAAARRWSEEPKALMLKACGVLERYREDAFSPSWYGGWPCPGWPTSAKGTAQSWRGKPPMVLLCGVNSAGKSMLAAEMMFRAIRTANGGIRSGFWVTQDALVEEDREAGLGQPRQFLHRAKKTGILVLDDLGWLDTGVEFVARLCELRLSARRPTIWTTHRPFSKGPTSLREYAYMIFTRLRDHAWVFDLPER